MGGDGVGELEDEVRVGEQGGDAAPHLGPEADAEGALDVGEVHLVAAGVLRDDLEVVGEQRDGGPVLDGHLQQHAAHLLQQARVGLLGEAQQLHGADEVVGDVGGQEARVLREALEEVDDDEGDVLGVGLVELEEVDQHAGVEQLLVLGELRRAPGHPVQPLLVDRPARADARGLQPPHGAHQRRGHERRLAVAAGGGGEGDAEDEGGVGGGGVELLVGEEDGLLHLAGEDDGVGDLHLAARGGGGGLVAELEQQLHEGLEGDLALVLGVAQQQDVVQLRIVQLQLHLGGKASQELARLRGLHVVLAFAVLAPDLLDVFHPDHILGNQLFDVFI